MTANWTNAIRGQIALLIEASQTATLETGRYQGQLTILDQVNGPLIGYQWQIDLTAAPGTEVEPPSYCSFSDLLTYGRAWVRSVQSEDDEAGFGEQRGRARSWLDDLILSRYPGQGYANLGDPGYGALAWGSASSTPNTWLRQQLDADLLILRPWVIECTAKKTLALICESQIGISETARGYAALGRHHANASLSLALSNAAEIADVNGVVTFSVNLGGGRVR